MPAAGPAPAPRGVGTRDPDDLNADGFRDLLTLTGRGDPVVLWGSSRGLDPDRYSVYPWSRLGLTRPAEHRDADLGGTGILTADLDSDGYPDWIAGDRIAWGGPQGPRPTHEATPLRVPRAAGDVHDLGNTVRGDFDGDGHHDLALNRVPATSQRGVLTVLYGPFDHAGVPDRSETRPSDEGELTVDDIDRTGKRRPTALLFRFLTEGEQTAPTRYEAGRDGLARHGRKLRAGNGTAFGDFDGDGTRDLVIGDTGTANDELDATEQNTSGTATLYPGDGSAAHTFDLPANSSHTENGYGRYATAHLGPGAPDALIVPTASGATVVRVSGGRSLRLQRTLGGPDAPGHTQGEFLGTADLNGDGRDEVLLGRRDRTDATTGEVPSRCWVIDPTTNTDINRFGIGDGGP
ncbi:hypothetical protein [Streptomyces sp. NPDC049813]|uniref:hypothetical protein n=1 Tax=Streptomyces sp. NPDC049813 TaxID=3365597 RepID=UPI0037AC0304